jgi:ABC-type spermidine/putrescine transport system permease subunit II
MTEEKAEGPSSIDRPTAEAPMTGRQRALMIAGALVFLLILAGAVLAVVALARNPDTAETVRDIVIIFMAVESLVIGVALIVLIVQLARLTALLQDEVRPILDSTNETLNTLRGTTTFLSNNLVKPVIKANSSVAAVRRVLELIRPGRTR